MGEFSLDNQTFAGTIDHNLRHGPEANTMKGLPIGMTDISEIIGYNCIYADKTRYIYDLLRLDYPFFLSRPRRFGKTLLVDTLEAI
ncbi:MAG: AAA family ATPase, partial [Deltaproteobacteria bacterium]|nr:AAA family ATPase [Deltaproteobacteria bacterium]